MDMSEILAEGENSSVEYKVTASREVAKEVAAFASSRGGTVIVGVAEPHREAVGLDEPFEDVRQKIQSWIHEFVRPAPPYLIARVEHNGRELLVVVVDTGSEPAYAYKEVFYYRNNEQSQPMPASEVTRRMFQVRMANEIERLAAEVHRSHPSKNTAAGITGQGELATLNYNVLLERIIHDLKPHFVSR